MSTNVKRWLPIALCCLPGIAVAAVVGIGIAVGGAAFGASFGGPLSLGLIALALLACPLSMGLMMRPGSNRAVGRGSATTMTCCAPDASVATTAADKSERLTALRAQRERLEREVAELQAH